MADSAHIEILRHGPKAWNSWREQNPDQRPNLEGVALGLSERQLGPANGGPVNLQGARLSRAFLRSACLSGADLEAADLAEADVSSARLDGANLTGANLAHAVLDNASFSGAILTSANVRGASLRGAKNLTQAQINALICDLSTIFPEHLVHPVSTLAARSNDGLPLPREQADSKFFSPLVHR